MGRRCRFRRLWDGHFSFIDTFETTLAPNLLLLASLRRALETWLEDADVADPARSELVLATHEAAANAIEHSASPVEIRARRAGASVVVEVRDHGRWQPARIGNEERGRGLKLIEGLVSALMIETDEDGTTLRLQQDI